MKRLLIAITIFALGGIVIASEPGSAKALDSTPLTLKGSVMDKISGEALTGVKIKLEGSDRTEYTDFDGNFEISELLPGKYTLTVEYISYESKKLEKIEINHSRDELAVKLQPSTISLNN